MTTYTETPLHRLTDALSDAIAPTQPCSKIQG
jgi:hypothetical protein